jgi:hypothetical protein
MAMVAKPTVADAARATHRPRRSPRQGVRASWSKRALKAGSRDLGFLGNRHNQPGFKW